MKEIESYLNEEIKADNILPKDHPERVKSEALFSMLEKGGAEFPKLRLRYYGSTHRGIHAACNIVQGETMVKIPFPLLITINECKATPVGKQMLQAGLFMNPNLSASEFDFFAVYLLTEIQKKKEDKNYKSAH